MLTEPEKETFEQELIANGLNEDWVKNYDTYHFHPHWWESFMLMELDGGWAIYHYDHDAGIDDNGQSTTSFDILDARYSNWIAAAKEVEKKW